MPFPTTQKGLQQALAKKLRAMDASDGSPWDNATGERARAAKEVAKDYDWAPLGSGRRPWDVPPQAQSPPRQNGYAVARTFDTLHHPVQREDKGVFWSAAKPQAVRVKNALNQLEEEAEEE